MDAGHAIYRAIEGSRTWICYFVRILYFIRICLFLLLGLRIRASIVDHSCRRIPVLLCGNIYYFVEIMIKLVIVVSEENRDFKIPLCNANGFKTAKNIKTKKDTVMQCSATS